MRRCSVFLWSLAWLLSIAQYAAADDGNIFIEFMSRPTAPITEGTSGHVFFCIRVQLITGLKEDCFGFYQKSGAKAFDGPGFVSNEFKKSAITRVSASLSHKIDENTRRAIYSEIQKWAGNDYKLLVSNCMDFALTIAKTAGLKVPDRAVAKVPTEFVDNLRKLYWSRSWKSTDVSARFSFVFDGNNVEWREVNPESKQTIKKTVPLKTNPDGSLTVERPNAPEVLQGLGYSAAIIPAIVAAGPRDSFITIRRLNNSISGEWNGLVVIKDKQGRFTALKQPGSFPSKHFDFDRLN
jgi:hypothetical protein